MLQKKFSIKLIFPRTLFFYKKKQRKGKKLHRRFFHFFLCFLLLNSFGEKEGNEKGLSLGEGEKISYAC